MDSEGQQPVQTPVEPAAPPAAEPSVELAVEPSVEESAGEVGGGEVVEPQSTDVPAIESEEAPVAAASQPALKRWLSLAQDRGRIGVARFRGLDRRIQAGVGAALVLVLLASGALVFAVAPRGGGAQPSAGTSPSDIAVSPSGSSFSPVASPTSSASPGPTIEPWTMPPNTGGNRIAVGFGHVCFILTTGKVKCWGRNDDGQLGTESAEDSLVPATVVGVANARSIVAGYADNSAVTCALIADGSIECWGGGTTAAGPNGIQGIGQVTRLFSGATAGCYYLSEGKLGSCELGPDDLAMEMEGASAVATTSESTCLLVKGAMKCKASVPDGEEFTGTIRGITGATAIAAGTDETCAIVAKGAVKCWGMNQLESAAAPKAYTINGITGARAIALGEVFGCAIVAKGGVKCWGSNDSGQLGLGHAEQANPGIDYYRGYTVKGISGATAIGAGGTTACVALSGDDIRCWGLNDNGQLGDGTTVTCSSPVGVTGLSKASSTCKTPYDPNATPTPRPTPSPSPSPSPTPTAGPTVTPTPAPTPTPEATPTPREAPTETPAS